MCCMHVFNCYDILDTSPVVFACLSDASKWLDGVDSSLQCGSTMPSQTGLAESCLSTSSLV